MLSMKYSRTNLRRQCALNAGIRLWNAYLQSSYLHGY